MKSTKPSDTFDLYTCLGGFAKWMDFVSSDLYEFCYYMTFKRELKSYFDKFNDPYEKPVDFPAFFMGNEDPIVQHCLSVEEITHTFYENFLLRNGLVEELIVEDDSLVGQASRYAVSHFPSLKRRSYSFMKFHYIRYLGEMINTFYYYGCALTLNSYFIPHQMRVKIDYSYQGSFRFLNIENKEVYQITEFILKLNVLRKGLK